MLHQYEDRNMVTVNGIRFDCLKTLDIQKPKGVKVLYRAVGNGPKFWVSHFGQTDSSKKEDLRLAFSRIVGKHIIWREEEKTYFDRLNEVKVTWNQQLSRFIPTVTKPAREKDKETSNPVFPESKNLDSFPKEPRSSKKNQSSE